MADSTGALFDRFETDAPDGVEPLVRDLIDAIGARRLHTGRTVGLMEWGLRNTFGLNPSLARDRQSIAKQIENQLNRFEPRLRNVRVTPLSDEAGFRFDITASVVSLGGEPVFLRIIAPRCGGGLGADLLAVE